MHPNSLRAWISKATILAVALIACGIPSPAYSISYNDAADGTWSTPATWGVGSGFPSTAADTVLIDNTRTIDVDVSVTIGSLTVTNNALQTLNATTPQTITTPNFTSSNINNFTIGAGLSLDLSGTGLYQTRGGTVNGTLNILNGATLTYTNNQAQNGSGNIHIQSGGKIDMQSSSHYNQYDGSTGMALDNDGLFEFNNSGTFKIQTLSVVGDGQWKINSGGVSFNNSAQTIALNPLSATFTGATGNILFDNVANTTHTLGSFNMSGTNTVEFADSNLATFQINGSSTFQNLTLTSGDVVDLAPTGGGAQTHSANGTLTMASGTLSASDAAGAILNANDFAGGTSAMGIASGVTLNIAGTGSLVGNGTMTLNGTIGIQNGGSLTIISREVFGSGDINVATGAQLILDGTSNSNRKIDPNITNNGLIKSTNGNIRPLNGTISGTGTFLAESGTLDVDSGSTTVTGWTGTGTFASQATWHAQGGGVIDFFGSNNAIATIGSDATLILEDTGSILQLNGSTRNNLAVDGALHVRGSANLQFNAGQGVALSGTLRGDGAITGNVISTGGTIAPGNSPGTLTIFGNLSLDAASLLDFELGGTTEDLLIVSGALTLDGVLNVTSLGNFGIGTYDLIQYGALGANNTLEIGTTPNAAFNYSILTGGGLVQLQVTASDMVPEPATGSLLGISSLLVITFSRRRRQKT